MFLDSPSDRNSYTSFGIHLNGKGKHLITKQVTAAVNKLAVKESIIPIVLEWHPDHESGKTEDVIVMGNNHIDTEGFTVEVSTGTRSDCPIIQEGMTINKSRSKRTRNAPINRSQDFLW